MTDHTPTPRERLAAQWREWLESFGTESHAGIKASAAPAEIERLSSCLAKGATWVSTDERSPNDEQTVIGYWPTVGSCTPFFESVTYYARDAPDGPERWHNAWGEETDAPHYWMPQSALPEAPR